MNEYNEILQRKINIYEDAITDIKAVLELIKDASYQKHITLLVDEKVVVLGPFGVAAIMAAISAKIIQYKSAITNLRRHII